MRWWFGSAVRGAEPTHQLYVSPHPTALAQVFEVVVNVLTELQTARAVKVGGNIYFLLLPEKIVCYFDSFEELRASAAEMINRLDPCRCQGVPFTAELVPSGLLSWSTCRGRIVRFLASTLASLHTEHDARLQPWQVALERIRLEGVDPDTWQPDPNRTI